ncbi:zinc-dependent alcohol dehydrogenase family protein [Phyllobacteriaceae bacterium SYSU D60010]|uniref:zinc-dependent alcohol dehydrogenase family protein n=1 Tax=Taklimakanibacter deserti TaxID=2267839 RepID=UPI000E64801F
MMLVEYGQPLVMRERALPVPRSGEIRVRIGACGVCRTDLHVVDGELPKVPLPLVPGHEIVGYVEEIGAGVAGFELGQRVGIPWLGHTCGQCAYCLSGHENLCNQPLFTGYTRDGGYATHAIADAHYAFALADGKSDECLAPLLCAGLIGWRSLRIAGDAKRLGLYGFGAAAHIVAQVAKWEGRRIFAFTRRADTESQAFARQLGAEWAGASDQPPPEQLDAAIIYAPIGTLVPQALKAVRKGGRVVCAGIHMSDIPSFPYSLLWEERQVVSVANLTRDDGDSFLRLVPKIGIETTVSAYPLAEANQALSDLRQGRLRGAAVLKI